MQNFERGAPHDPIPSEPENPIHTEIGEFFELLELKHGLLRLDLPYDALSATIKHMNRRVEPAIVAEFASFASQLFADMQTEMTAIDTDRRNRLN